MRLFVNAQAWFSFLDAAYTYTAGANGAVRKTSYRF
jgi:hypothetical protein